MEPRNLGGVGIYTSREMRFRPEGTAEISRWWRLCGTTGNKAERPPSPERASEPRLGLSPFQGWERYSTPYRWFRKASTTG
jgi:hypothetical protein